jgi:hypothetical protein
MRASRRTELGSGWWSQGAMLAGAAGGHLGVMNPGSHLGDAPGPFFCTVSEDVIASERGRDRNERKEAWWSWGPDLGSAAIDDDEKVIRVVSSRVMRTAYNVSACCGFWGPFCRTSGCRYLLRPQRRCGMKCDLAALGALEAKAAASESLSEVRHDFDTS